VKTEVSCTHAAGHHSSYGMKHRVTATMRDNEGAEKSYSPVWFKAVVNCVVLSGGS
jgi:hypothetical protein